MPGLIQGQGAEPLPSWNGAPTNQSFIEFPPMQAAASFNLEAVKAKIEKAIQARMADKAWLKQHGFGQFQP